ncbi:uncharacterized protein V1510DRAFT_367890, partial [Dipodascopsis tothii]|uniref:uncharacterized protein n=1 Tax=Dipodascopsis tothii TaxID=44089 RepID=UPI0034CE419A
LSETISVSMERSRRSWLTGVMFQKFWTRPQRGRKLVEGQYNARDKMAKFCDCKSRIGPHFFDIRLFLVKDAPVMKSDSDGPDANVPRPVSHDDSVGNDISSDRDAVITKHQPSLTGTSKSSSVADSDAEDKAQAGTPAPSVIENAQVKAATAIPSSGLPMTAAQSTDSKPAINKDNKLLIGKLQSLAKQDTKLGLLMKTIASGKGTQDEIAQFQKYISYARSMPNILPDTSVTSGDSGNMLNRPLVETKPKKTKPHVPRKEKDSQPVFLVFEFRDNPTDRFLLPRQSLIKIDSEGTIKICFYLEYDPEAITGAKHKVKEKTAPPKVGSRRSRRHEDFPEEATVTQRDDETNKRYVPLVFTLFGIPKKLQETFFRAVDNQDDVSTILKQRRENLQRSTDWWVYYQVDSTTSQSVNRIVEPIGNNNPNVKKKPWSTKKEKMNI